LFVKESNCWTNWIASTTWK